MNQLLAMRAFRAIVEARGFSAAAERLDTTHSTLSRQLQQLEAFVGASLIHRNTRQLSLTAAGEGYYAACVDILARVDAAAYEAAGRGGAAKGVLKVSAPLVLGTLELAHWLPAWQAGYPQVELELSCDDRFIDLVAEGIDVALRITADLANTTLMARRLATVQQVLVATPAYVARHGLPRTPQALEGHVLLGFGSRPWTLQDTDGRKTTLEPGKGFRSDAITALYAAVMAGAGIAVFTLPTVQADLDSARLVRLLPDHTAGQRHYTALYPQTRHLSAAARAFIDFMVAHYAD